MSHVQSCEYCFHQVLIGYWLPWIQLIYCCCIFQVKSCVTAFHVTCGFKHGLEMRTVLDDTAADGVRHIVSSAAVNTQLQH